MKLNFTLIAVILVFFLSDNNLKPHEFMNVKKSHEVQAMSELISSIADYYGVKQVRVLIPVF